MGGRIKDLVSALRIFLKSLPPGVMFNICSFGSDYSFLWNHSVVYTEESLNQATRHVEEFSADMGGTEIYEPMKQAFSQRYPDMELEVIMLTDGQIYGQDTLFDLIKNEVRSSKGAVRVFTLGVGSGASSSLIEGAARAGNGVAQSVCDDEKMDTKVIRTLKATLTPHTTDYSLEIKYEKADEDDFEIIEKVMANVSMDEEDKEIGATDGPDQPETTNPAPMSLFDPNYKEDLTAPKPPSIKDKYAHLPALSTPSYLQAPCTIPPLFAFNRTTIYVLLSESSPGKIARSVVLRGTSKHGSLELEIEIKHLEKPGQTIHQLAARKAVQDLESNDGWLSTARRTSDNKLLKEAKPSKFSGIVEREAVKLGMKYQVSGKWCSFVAIDDTKQDTAVGDVVAAGSSSSSVQRTFPPRFSQRRVSRGKDARHRFMSDVRSCSARGPTAPPPPPAPAGGLFGGSPPRPALSSGSTTMFGAAENFDPSFVSSDGKSKFSPEAMRRNSIGNTWPDVEDVELGLDGYSGGTPVSTIVEHTPDRSPGYSVTTPDSPGVDHNLLARYQAEMECATSQPLPYEGSDDDLGSTPPRSIEKKKMGSSVVEAPTRRENKLQALIALQTFAGNWSWTPNLEKLTGSRAQHYMSLEWPGCSDVDVKGRVSATVCAIRFFKVHLAAQKEVWEMVVEKAEDYLLATTGQSVEDLEKVASQIE
jgi:hypothetical protein